MRKQIVIGLLLLVAGCQPGSSWNWSGAPEQTDKKHRSMPGPFIETNDTIDTVETGETGEITVPTAPTERSQSSSQASETLESVRESS